MQLRFEHVHGPADSTGDGVTVTRDVQQLAYTYCHRGVQVEFHIYNGLDHDQAGIPFFDQAQAFLAQAVIAVTSYGPFGEQERAAGRWLPWLRLGAAVALTAVAFGVLAAGAAAGGMPGGSLALLRNLGGVTGIGLLSAAILGGAFAWVGPMAFLLITEGALAHRSVTPWVWPARPPYDRGGAICACLVIAAGLGLITVSGPRESGRESGPAS